MEIIKVSDDGTTRVVLEIDGDQLDPRTAYDHLAYAVTVPGSRYIDVDKDTGPLGHGWEHYKDHHNAPVLFARWARIFHGAATTYHKPYDGPESVWYMMPDTFKDVTSPSDYMTGEIAEYQAWANGEVYGYRIQYRQDWQHVNDGSPENDEIRTTWEDVEGESQGGWYGHELAYKAAEDAFAVFLRDDK